MFSGEQPIYQLCEQLVSQVQNRHEWHHDVFRLILGYSYSRMPHLIQMNIWLPLLFLTLVCIFMNNQLITKKLAEQQINWLTKQLISQLTNELTNKLIKLSSAWEPKQLILWTRVLPEKLIIAKLVNKFFILHEAWRFITMLKNPLSVHSLS
jgi:hypothetical protein